MEENNEEGTRKKPLGLGGLIKFLVVIVVLSWLLVPAGSRPRETKKTRVRVEIASIRAAIEHYTSVYGVLPVSTNIDTNSTDDFTFGTSGTSASKVGITNAVGYQANNSEVIAILMDLIRFPNGRETVNVNHSRNTNSTPFLSARQVNDTNLPGVGSDYVFRDPWGNPYIITIDLNRDGKCRDAFYRLASVSEKDANSQVGSENLQRAGLPPYDSAEKRDAFEANATVMVWSLGPDGKADRSKKAGEGVNKDNIISW